MKAIQYKAFGGSDVIELAEIQAPTIQNEKDILIQVKAASVNPVDMKIRMGFMQQIRPVEMPFVPGSDAAGIVVGVGAGVTKFKAGDEVIAVPMKNAYAEQVVANEDFVLPKPNNLSFEEATSVAINIGAAESVLFREGKLEKGQTVLIQGGAGAAGAAMIQMAKGAGAYVVATASGKGIALAKSLGADEVIDYKSQDVAALVKDVDLVADCVGGESQARLFEVVKTGGKLLSIGTPPSAELAEKYHVDARFVVSDLSAMTLKAGLQMVKDGELKPLVTKTFRLEEAAQAQDFLSAGGVNGKVVLVVGK
jgi:NADPH:quinone reductase-like Zn-dependent oxidoreductase